MSLSFFKDFGWEAEVVCVDEKYSEIPKDELLLQSVPKNVIVHQVKAFSKKWTSKFGLGSLALRSLWFYHKKVMLLLPAKKYDLIYFSTTEFPVCVLGAYWKKRFAVPYVIDMQDAWHSTYYQDKPKEERPPKYWFSYRLHKYLEPIAMKKCDGLISVSPAYIDTLQQRYPQLKNKPAAVIPFGAFEKDFEIAEKNIATCPPAIQFNSDNFNVVYVGRGGADMQTAVQLLFYALKEALQDEAEVFSKLHLYFIGTSYAPKELAKQTIFPLAIKCGVEKQVTEVTDRIGFYSTINTLLAADALFIPGSNDPQYTASKIYPYLMAQKPLLTIFHQQSSAVPIIRSCSPHSSVITFPDNPVKAKQQVRETLNHWAKFSTTKNSLDRKTFEEFTARQMVRKQVEIFEAIVKG
ncbi:glycosyltransferase [Mucilaginibacter arboris]|uniref:Glycosyltransferase n=1 Tax=Mucilaginibacter arboris TaxID=2682090 RepID=A0A7K1STI3_9SPHI|nr:glycosyltransferase [Mucilaginibacter arboris]MVN20618.1 glycosyltransferase [Mucilaginibacter arboris]